MNRDAQEFIKEQKAWEKKALKRRAYNQRRREADKYNAHKRYKENWMFEQDTKQALKDFGFDS